MKRLQVLVNEQWEYVFCRNELKRKPIVTQDKMKAIKGDKESLKYFKDNYGDLEFRIV